MSQRPLPSTQQHSSRPKLLIVEDDESIRIQMKWGLAQDYEVFLAEDRKTTLEILRGERPAVVTLDLGLPPHPRAVEEGFLTLSDILEQDAGTKVIIITGRGGKEDALKAIGQGAYDFLDKPIQVEELRVILRRAYHVSQLERENRELQWRLHGESFHEMLGTSPPMREVFVAMRKVATTDAPVLIVGESGTGKELAARAIHRQGARNKGPFVVINCGAIPETLLESELFGHEKGAFTGAYLQRRGRLEAAQSGTLFLDEIGELSLPLQVKLLRFLQEHRVERVGGRETIAIDVRVMAATSIDLQQAIAHGRFREDLYYRLAVVVLAVPPLRERGEDIALLAHALLQTYAAESRKKIVGFSRHAIAALHSYRWPGNVRELENRIKRAVIMAEGPRLTPADLELTAPDAGDEGPGLREARQALEKDLIQRALARYHGNITQAAAHLGISRPTLYELMEKLGIRRVSGGAC